MVEKSFLRDMEEIVKVVGISTEKILGMQGLHIMEERADVPVEELRGMKEFVGELVLQQESHGQFVGRCARATQLRGPSAPRVAGPRSGKERLNRGTRWSSLRLDEAENRGARAPDPGADCGKGSK